MAAYQANPGATLLAAAPDCAAGRVMLEALEVGTDGVLLQTDSPAEVREGRLSREQAAAQLRQAAPCWWQSEEDGSECKGCCAKVRLQAVCFSCCSQPAHPSSHLAHHYPIAHACRCGPWRSTCSSGSRRAGPSCSMRLPQ